MNDKRTIYIYTGLLFLSAFLLSSCSQEDTIVRAVTEDDSEILFYTSLPDIETRSADDIDKNSIKNGFDVSAACLDSVTPGGYHLPIEYFSSQKVMQTPGMGEAFRSNSCRWSSNKGGKAGKLRFFAFYPSREVLRDSAGIFGDERENFFRLEYTNTNKDTIEYWMKSFKVNKDIAKHSDFVTATTEGSKTDNLYSGVNLTLQHQLSRIILEAFSNSESYDVEIAGVRIGGIAIESDFSFEGIPVNFKNWNWTKIGRWIGVNQKKDVVEYIYRDGDRVITINKENNPDESKAVSLMGKGGPALVIPYDYGVWWEYAKKPNKDHSLLYFSVLLRVKEKLTENHTLLYPYIEGANLNSSVTVTANNMKVVYLSIKTATGEVMKRVYKKGSNFYTDPNCSDSSLYSVPIGEEIRNYGWASAIPYIDGAKTQRWNPGYQYIFQLDFSKGIGVQDPDDALPGRVIIYPIEVTGSQAATWHTVKNYDNVEIKDGDVNFTIE
ncbi:MAG: fimbrillin family protein [Muribaculaceae bacterium]|nr:fimbrillin family protein [Muribaculaceae bacterium]